MRTKYSVNLNHAGHKCYLCDGLIYGEGVIAEIIGVDEGCTCYHTDCYSKAWAALVEKERQRADLFEVLLVKALDHAEGIIGERKYCGEWLSFLYDTAHADDCLLAKIDRALAPDADHAAMLREMADSELKPDSQIGRKEEK